MADEPEMLITQALVVTDGPFAGRICENDDDAFTFADDFSAWELEWIEAAGVQWRKPIRDPDAPPEEDDDEWYSSDGVDCEIVTFGRYLECSGHYYMPRQFLRPATLDDLFKRHEEIRNSIFRRASRFSPRKMKSEELIEFMVEQSYISDEIWARELKLLTAGGEKSVFLCHASVDKPTVRKVCNDLTHAGHKVWMDEFEINVGDSIVDKINQATAKADALVIFMSNASTSSSWVQREWQSTLARRLSGQSVAILPARTIGSLGRERVLKPRLNKPL